jgi:hypothetical protein
MKVPTLIVPRMINRSSPPGSGGLESQFRPSRSIYSARLILSITCALFVVGLHSVHGADTHWKAGVASAVITPDEPLMLAGYASRDAPATGKLDDLHAKALALEDEKGLRALILTADIIGFTAEVANPISSRMPSTRRISGCRAIATTPSVMFPPRACFTKADTKHAAFMRSASAFFHQMPRTSS